MRALDAKNNFESPDEVSGHSFSEVKWHSTCHLLEESLDGRPLIIQMKFFTMWSLPSSSDHFHPLSMYNLLSSHAEQCAVQNTAHS